VYPSEATGVPFTRSYF